MTKVIWSFIFETPDDEFKAASNRFVSELITNLQNFFSPTFSGAVLAESWKFMECVMSQETEVMHQN